MSIWFIGIVAAWIIIACKKLCKFDGTRYRDRLVFSLTFAIILTTANLLMMPPSAISVGYGLVIGIILTIPFAFLEQAWFARRLDGAILRYKPNQYLRTLVFCIAISAGFIFLFRTASPDMKSTIMIALCCSWISGSILGIVRLIRIEARLGQPVLEESKKPK